MSNNLAIDNKLDSLSQACVQKDTSEYNCQTQTCAKRYRKKATGVEIIGEFRWQAACNDVNVRQASLGEGG